MFTAATLSRFAIESLLQQTIRWKRSTVSLQLLKVAGFQAPLGGWVWAPHDNQKEERVLAHILICFLGYALWKAVAQWMRRGGLGDAPRTLLEEFAKIKSGDVVLPARMADGSGRTIHLRCVTTPDEAQKILLNRLGLTLPQRLRRIDEVAQM